MISNHTIILYRSLSNSSSIVDHGVMFSNAAIPFSQNKFSKDGLNPEIMDAPFLLDKQGNPEVDRKFQNRI